MAGQCPKWNITYDEMVHVRLPAMLDCKSVFSMAIVVDQRVSGYLARFHIVYSLVKTNSLLVKI